LQRKKQGAQNRRWTFGKSVLDLGKNPSDDTSKSFDKPSSSPLQQYYYRSELQSVPGFQINSVLSEGDLHETDTLEELRDLRENVPYQKFVKKLGLNLNLGQNGYENLKKEYKTELKYAAGNLMHLQLRSVINRSIKVFVSFFKGFKTYGQLQQLGQIKKMRHIVPPVTKITAQ
jgi:hypothetical protein